MKKTLIVASLLALAGASSVAAAADDNWFVRGELGSSNVSVDGFSGSDSETAGSVRGGYYFTPNFAIEGVYNDYGTRNDGVGDSAKLEAWGLGLVGKKDFGPGNTGFFIDGRVDVLRDHTRVDAAGGGSASDDSTKGSFGVGAGWDFNRNFGLSLNYDYTKIDAFNLSGHIGTVTGALEARF
jgi:OmpA-OmpF porin, OOP family